MLYLALLILGEAQALVDIVSDKELGAVIKNDSCFTHTVSVNGKDFEVPARSQKAIGSPKWSEWKWYAGTMGSILPREIRSPLKNKSRFEHGPGTGIHLGDLVNGYDFEVPEGTPVYAIAEGVVVKVVDHFTQAHQDPKRVLETNEIEVLHPDGTVSRYVHLQPKGAVVKVCDTVRAGQLLGKSGHTGFSQGPHLHFELYRPVGMSKSMTISVTFRSDLESK